MNAPAAARTTNAPSPADPPRVVHVITALGTGGAERQLEWITRHCTARSSTIALYAGGPVADSMRTGGAEVTVLGMGGWRRWVTPLRLARHIRRARPDIVHVHLLAGQLWGIPAARLAGVRAVVSSEHSLMDTTIENRPLTGRLRRTYRLLERWTTGTVAVSATTRTRLLRWGIPAGRITVIDNGIDIAALTFSAADRDRIRTDLGIGPDSEVVAAVGRLEPVKRFDELIGGLAPDLRTGRRHLVIAGAGPQLVELQELAARLGVAGQVHLLGARSDIPAVLSAADVLVSPSRDETFGMAVVEARLAGLPVVYAQCPALEELPVRPSGCHPLPAPGPDAGPALSAAVAAALRNAATRTGTRLDPDHDLERRYGIGDVAVRWDQLYRGLSS